jgi:hypothetical protein
MSPRLTRGATSGGIQLDRQTKKREAADLIVFLASPRATAITGTEYVIGA